MHRGILTGLFFLCVTLFGTLTLTAASPKSLPAVQPLKLSDDEQGNKNLYALLRAIGYDHKAQTESTEDPSRAAIRAFQRSHKLPETGRVNAPTLHLFGGPAAQLDAVPRFFYPVQPGDTLSGIARRFAVPLFTLLRFNAEVESIETIYIGQKIVVPVLFPLLGELAIQHARVCVQRFLGTYASHVPFSEVSKLEKWYASALAREGYSVEMDEESPLEKISFSGRGITLGQVSFGALETNDSTRVDIGLLFTESENVQDAPCITIATETDHSQNP